jgi:PPM family protein phosphatase
MTFMRRLFGSGSKEKPSVPPAPAPAAPRPEAQITPPGIPIEVKPPEPTIEKSEAPPDLLTSATSVMLPNAANLAPSNGNISPVTAILPPDPTMYDGTHQLAVVEGASTFTPGRHLVYGFNSDVGAVRTNNQDSMFSMFSASLSAENLPDFGLFVVADGMGGHHDGEKASAVASRIVADHLFKNFYMKALQSNSNDDMPIISEVLVEAVEKANQAVSSTVPDGGTTVTAAALLRDMAYIAHVGDSRAYLFSKGSMDQITRDHSLVQRLIELDQITPDEALTHPHRSVLYRAVGQNETIEIDTATRRLPAGSRLMLCSDGLWNMVPETLLIDLVNRYPNPQEACDKLVALANERGGNDNITIILVQMPG